MFRQQLIDMFKAEANQTGIAGALNAVTDAMTSLYIHSRDDYNNPDKAAKLNAITETLVAVCIFAVEEKI